MDITAIDKNFKLPEITEMDVEWINATDPRIALYGVYYSEEEGEAAYRRMSQKVANSISDGVSILSKNTSGGRLRLVTDSPYFAIKCMVADFGMWQHMTVVTASGFSLYTDGKFQNMYAPTEVSKKAVKDGRFAYNGIRYFQEKKERELELYFPLYNAVYELYIGIKKGSTIKPAPKYAYEKPMLFYGSSITQGGCASRPGNDYAGYLERWLNTDYINLGFSGSGKAEPIMVEYLSEVDASVYVLDYDHNAPTAEYLEETHYPLYKAIREKHKNAPIVCISRPDFENGGETINSPRRNVVKATVEKATQFGDKNVYFIDGETLFGEEDRDSCTVDGCHPNDLGFYRMAKTIYPVLKEALEKTK